MTCPMCAAHVSRWAYLGASALSGVACEACGARLAPTLESRGRLNGGGFLICWAVGGLVLSLGGPVSLALGAGAAALLTWFLLRTDALLVLRPAQLPPSIR